MDTVDLAIAIGISVAVSLLIIAVIIICCCSRHKKRKRKGEILKKSGKPIEANGAKGHNVVVEQSRRELANENIESPANQHSTATDEIDNGQKVDKKSEVVKGIHHGKDINTVDNVDELYATVNKQKSQNSHTMTSLENVEVFIPDENGDSGNTSRNSPDGAADVIMDVRDKSQLTEIKVIHETKIKRSGDNVNNNSSGEVFMDDDVTKLHSNGGYVHVNHEISYSSGDDDIGDRSSVASSRPSVSFHDKTYTSDYDHLRFKTTKIPSKASIASSREGSEYYPVGPDSESARIIMPDSSGMARVFVSSDVKKHKVKKGHSSGQNVLSVGDVRVNPDPRVVPLSQTYYQTGSRSLDRNAFGSRQVQHVPERYVIGYRPDVRDNISMRTDGGYALSEYAVPASRRIYTSASTISSLGRDRSRSIDEPIYYIPSSRRGSIGSAYSLVASTYNPRQYAQKRYVHAGKLRKAHKPLSGFDLHKMKYRSYKGKLAPYSIPL